MDINLINTHILLSTLVVSMLTLFFTIKFHKQSLRSYINLEIYCMVSESNGQHIIYAQIKNIGSLDAYNISVEINGITNKNPFCGIKIINKNVAYRTVLMDKQSIRDISNNINCKISYNDRFRKKIKKPYKHEFEINLNEISSRSINYNKNLDLFDISLL